MRGLSSAATIGGDVLLVGRRVTERMISQASRGVLGLPIEQTYLTPFDKKFAQREKLHVGNREVDILDLKPEEGNLKSPQTVVALPGFFESIENAEFAIRELHNEGYRVLSFDPESYSPETHTQIASALIDHATEVSGHPKVSLFLTSMGACTAPKPQEEIRTKLGWYLISRQRDSVVRKAM